MKKQVFLKIFLILHDVSAVLTETRYFESLKIEVIGNLIRNKNIFSGSMTHGWSEKAMRVLLTII